MKESETSLSQTQVQLNKSKEEVNKVSTVLGRQEEKIRRCLYKKGIVVQDIKDDNSKIENDLSALSEEEESYRMLEELKKEERLLALEKKRIEDKLMRMQSRKEKLKLKVNGDNLEMKEVAPSWD